MTMRWQIETWRKVYTRVPSDWALLPWFARATGTELLKYADDHGRIKVGDGSYADELVSICAVKPLEADAFRAALAQLLADGYLILETSAVLIRNFEAAQQRSTGADRQAKHRAKAAAVPRRKESKRTNSNDEIGVTDKRYAGVTPTPNVSRDKVTDPVPVPVPERGEESARAPGRQIDPGPPRPPRRHPADAVEPNADPVDVEAARTFMRDSRALGRLATQAFAKRAMGYADTLRGGKLTPRDVLEALREADEKLGGALDANAPPMDIDALSARVIGYLKHARRGDGDRAPDERSVVATGPPLPRPRIMVPPPSRAQLAIAAEDAAKAGGAS